MPNVMKGVRILEVAEHTFVPAASAILADWGAEVIKIEHLERGDAMRGLASSGVMSMTGPVHVLLEHSNRGKKSIGVDLTTEKGVELVYRLAATCDVFLTNKLPAVRKRLRIGARRHPAAQSRTSSTSPAPEAGSEVPRPTRGVTTSSAIGAVAASAMGCTPTDAEGLVVQPAPGYGDSIGGMTIAGGIMGALFHRERTGEAVSVDVSLLGVGLWAMSPAVALSLQMEPPLASAARLGRRRRTLQPARRYLRTQDGRFLAFSCLQGFHYWPGACRAVGREDLITDERFASHELLSANAGAPATS